MGSSKICVTSLGLLWTCFMVNLSFTASPVPEDSKPIIYLTFTRWENRTFSPRIYYLLMQRYGLQNKLLDLTQSLSTYHQSSTGPVTKSKVIGTLSPDGTLFGTRSAFPAIDSKQSFLSTRKHHRENNPLYYNTASPVVFPTGELPANSQTGFFRDRIAYPGSSSRRTMPGSLQSLSVNLVPQNVFGTPSVPSAVPGSGYTEEDGVDTLSLTLDMINGNDWQDQNAVFSPFSIMNILALLLLGSNGTTYDEIAARLRPRHPFTSQDLNKEERFHTAFQSLLNFLNQASDDSVILDVCNKIVIDKKYPVMAEFQRDAISYYDAQSDVFDFATQGPELAKAVNKWVSFKTVGKIPSVIDNPPNPETALMLINALYFKGAWETPFIPEITQRKPFYVSSTETIDVSMMTNILTLPYIETPQFRVVGIPYRGSKTGLFVFLPALPGVKGLQTLESQLTPEVLKKLHEMKLTQVTLQLPKMRVESDGSLKGVLARFGLDSLFSPKSANFSRISDTPGLFVSSIVHKAIFEMNEKGTEAAAVTVVTGDRNLDERPILFAVNRPFLFTIVNVKAKTVLFFGRVTRPLPLND